MLLAIKKDLLLSIPTARLFVSYTRFCPQPHFCTLHLAKLCFLSISLTLSITHFLFSFLLNSSTFVSSLPVNTRTCLYTYFSNTFSFLSGALCFCPQPPHPPRISLSMTSSTPPTANTLIYCLRFTVLFISILTHTQTHI